MWSIDCSFFVCTFRRSSFEYCDMTGSDICDAEYGRQAINNNCENSIIKNCGVVSTKRWCEMETNLDIMLRAIVVSEQKYISS